MEFKWTGALSRLGFPKTVRCAIIFGKNHSEAVYLGRKGQKPELEAKKAELEPSEAKF